MPENHVTIATYDEVEHANIAKARLASAGIDAVLVAVDGGKELVVANEDAVAARGSLADAREAVAEDLDTCPACGSVRFAERRGGVLAAVLTIVLVGFPVGRSGPRRKCDDCGHAWRR